MPINGTTLFFGGLLLLLFMVIAAWILQGRSKQKRKAPPPAGARYPIPPGGPMSDTPHTGAPGLFRNSGHGGGS